MKIIVLFFTILFVYKAQSQNFIINQGEEFQSPRVMWSNMVIGSDNTGFYFLRNKNGIAGKFMLHKIEKNTAKTIYLKEIEVYAFNAFCINNKLLLFASESKTNISNKTVSKIILYEFDAVTGEQIGEPKLVDQLTANSEGQVLFFNISFSPDNKKMLLTAETKQNEKLQKVICRLYNANNYSKIWEKEAITVYKNSTVSSSQYLIKNDETLMYMFEYLRSNHLDEIGKQDDIGYGVVISSGFNRSEKVIEIPNNGKSLKNVKLFQIHNELICAGNFSLGEKDVAVNAKRGLFFLRIDPSEQLIKSSSYELLTSKIEDKLFVNKNENTSITLSMPEIFFINNSYYVVWEHLSSGSSYHNMVAPKYRDEIIVTKYSKDDKLEWMQFIKRNSEPETAALNYFINDKLNLIYYENPSSIEKYPDVENTDRIDYKSAIPKTAVIVCTSVDADGKLKRSTIPFTNKPQLEAKDPLKLFSYDNKTLIVMVNITKKTRRYDILKLD